jgi:energy-coupling factor transport system permease protein
VTSPFAYVPRPGPLQSASPAAAIAYVGSLVAVAFLYSSPLVLAAAGLGAYLAGRLAGARGAVRAALRMSVALALLIVVVNALVVDRGETVLLRLGDWPLFGQVDVTAEALASGAVIGLRAAVTMIAFAVYSACVDPDRVLRSLRPIAGRSALTAALISRLVPVAAADASRLRDAGRLRGPGAAPLGRATMARRLLAGSLDRAVDVAATLELRGYSLPAADAARGGVRDRLARVMRRAARRSPLERFRPRHVPVVGSPRRPRSRARGLDRRSRSRYDTRFYAVGAAVLLAAIAGKVAGADGFNAYPTIQPGLSASTLILSLSLVFAGLAPWRRSA